MTSELERDLADLAATLRRSSVAVRSARGAGSGSGVIWSADGLIITNAHVARSAAVEIDLPDGRRANGRVERRDERRDLAAIRVDAAELTPANIRRPAELRVGEFVAAFGHPLGVPNVLSTGILFARYRPGRDGFVRSNVKVAPGNSGGALADSAGRVVGITSLVAGDLALAVPADDVEQFLSDTVRSSRLGVRLAPARLEDGRRAYAVLAVEPDSIADGLDLIVGDLILTRDPHRLAWARSLEVVRGGNARTVPVARGQSDAVAAA
jgi:serine protease Do